VQWLLGVAGTQVGTADVSQRFAPSFIAAISESRVVEFIASLTWLGSAEANVVGGGENDLVAALSIDGEVRMVLEAQVEVEEPNRFTSLLVRPPRPSPMQILETTPPSTEPVPDVIERVFRPVADGLKAGGIVVGVIRDGERSVVSFNGESSRRYEIGSITKTFTGLALADAVARGDVAYEDPVSRYVPAHVRMPREVDREITLIDLATHSSGLPRLPPNMFEGHDPADPYAHIDEERLYEELAVTTLESAIGSETKYSNFGFGLLLHVLGLACDVPTDVLVVDRICGPLALSRTGYEGNDLVPGHKGADGVPRWTGPMLNGAGRIISTVDDMLTFADAHMQPSATTLAGPIVDAVTPRRAFGMDRCHQALGWLVFDSNVGPVLFHNGGTGGFRSCLVAHPPSRTAVVALCNNNDDMDPPTFSVLAALIGSGSQSQKESDT
jgi:CubicO group peptidase (beta-lactamase class C family)